MRSASRSVPAGVRAEILTIEGTHPTRQRNLAVQRAWGRAIYFADHDSMVQPSTIRRLLGHLASGAAVSGGPNLPRSPRSPFEAVASFVNSTMTASPGVSARYRSVGAPRPATERSLILCNLMMWRESFLRMGGFDARLYPNEENELLAGLAESGQRMVHDPHAGVTKPRPGSYGQFARETFRYGRGRMQQVWVRPHRSDLPFILLLLLAWAFVGLVAWIGTFAVVGWVSFAISWVTGWTLRLDQDADRTLPRPRGWQGWGLAWLLLLTRGASYVMGMTWGAFVGWAARDIRLVALPVRFRRYRLDSRAMVRLVEDHVFHIGSWSKEVPARA